MSLQIDLNWPKPPKSEDLDGLEWFTDNVTEITETPTLDQVGLAIALGYLDLRFSGEWRTRFTDLALWLTRFEQIVPDYQLTDPRVHV